MKDKSIQIVSEALLCSNCGACNVICPKNAISFQFSSIGRMYAVVKEDCINCGLCTQVCPSLDKKGLHKEYHDRYIGQIRKVYVGKSTDQHFFENAQSGGACTAIIAYLLGKKLIDCAVLCRMSYGNPPLVESIVVKSVDELYECQKSCYTPVDILSSLKTIDKDKRIALVGLPCHIEGAELLMRVSQKIARIEYKIGLICDRTLCSGIQEVMMSYSPANSVKINWRKKDFQIDEVYYPYKNAPVVIHSHSGKEFVLPNYYRFALKDYFTSPRCRVCYDKLNIWADVVVGDPWGMSGIDWDKGASVLIIRSFSGEDLIRQMLMEQYLNLSERNVNELLEGQHIEQRRRSVAAYARAICGLPVRIDSFLYEQGSNVSLTSKELSIAKTQICDFIRRDQQSKEFIIKETRNLIKQRRTSEEINKWIVIRVLRKVKRKMKW